MKLEAALLALVVLVGCDTFFTIHTVVTDAMTGEPIPGAAATLVLDRGIEEPDTWTVTGPDGRIDIGINEPGGAWATLTVEKPGYQTWSTQFQERPETEFVIRLMPEMRDESSRSDLSDR